MSLSEVNKRTWSSLCSGLTKAPSSSFLGTSEWTSSPNSTSSDGSYCTSSQDNERDDDFMAGNANDVGDLSAPCQKRGYTFITRKRRAKALEGRFSLSSTRGFVANEETFALHIAECCACKKKCSIAFVEEPDMLSELFRSRNEYHSLRKHADRRMYLHRLICLTGILHVLHVNVFHFAKCSHWPLHFAGHTVLCQLHHWSVGHQSELVLWGDYKNKSESPDGSS